MVSFDIDEELLIPNEVAAKTGWFYSLPKGEDLATASEKIYGGTFEQPISALEWLTTSHPKVVNAARETAEFLEEAVSTVGSSYKQTVLWLFAGVATIGLGAIVLNKVLDR